MTLTQTTNHTDRSDTTVPAPGRGARALFGWSPAASPADTSFKRGVDRLLLSWVPTVVLFVAVFALLNIAPHLPRRAELAVDGVAALAGGAWCAFNFWRCRHAHCLVTGAGWLALSLFAFAEAGLGRSLIAGYEQPVFLGVLALAVLFEVTWYLTHRTTAIGGDRPSSGLC